MTVSGRAPTVLAGAAAWFVVALATPGASGESITGLRLESVDASACAERGEVSVGVTDVFLDGRLRRRPASQYRLVIDGQAGPAPRSTRAFRDTQRPLSMALVLQASRLYATELDRVRVALADFIGDLPPRARLTLVSYGGEVRRRRGYLTPAAAKRTLRDVIADEVAEPALVSALKAALKDLARRPKQHRRIVVVVSDGIDRRPSWDVFRGLGARARRLGLQIAPVAFSPIDERGPLLNLGELAKRSGGTFRWARSAGQLTEELANLAREVNQQRVMTFGLAGGCGQQRRLQLSAGAMVSNTLTLEPVDGSRGSQGKGKGRLWLAAVGLVLVGALLFGATWLLFLRRGKKRGR